MLLFHAVVFKADACLKHSNFLKVKVLDTAPHTQVQIRSPEKCPSQTRITPLGGPAVLNRNPTTSFLTATTLIYAIGAGITAAAGTRLALQLFLDKWFKLFSLQSRKP